MSWIYYLLEANLYLALFYAVYYLLLRHDTYYQLNRAYLLGSTMFAFIIPLLQLGVLKPLPAVTQQITQVSFHTDISVSTSVVNNISVSEVSINYYLVAYISITILMAVSFGIRIFQLSRLASKGKRMAGKDFHLIEMEDEGRAFSFFSYLFISKKFRASDTIIQHELVHIRQKHSLDIIYVELLKVMCWFNPAVYLLQNSIRELHEYIADSQVAINKQNINEYTDFLVSNAYGLPEPLLANSFFNKNLLKNRIMMLHQKRSGVLARLKLLIALPLLAGMLCLSTLGFTKDYHVIDLLPARNADYIKITQSDVPVLLLSPPSPAKAVVVHVNLEHALIANESFKNTPKFEVDLFSGSKYFDKAHNRIWLSVCTSSAQILSNGEYKYSAKNANTRERFKFMGSVKLGNIDIGVSNGTIKIKLKKENLTIIYDLLLENGTKVTGQYNGRHQTADWRH